MNFTDAVRKSMRKYLDGKLDLKAVKEVTQGDIMYTPDYFDELEAMLEEEAAPKKGKKSKKKEMTDEA